MSEPSNAPVRELITFRVGEQFWSVHLTTGHRSDIVQESLRWRPTRVENVRGDAVVPLPPQDDGMAVAFERNATISVGASEPVRSSWRSPRGSLQRPQPRGPSPVKQIVPPLVRKVRPG